MAKNRYRSRGRKLNLRVADINGSGAGDLCKSGDPGLIGRLPVVCLTDEDADGNATVDTLGVYKLDVNNTTAGVIAPGAAVHWDNTAGELRDSGAGTYFGTIVGKTNIPATTTLEVEVRVGF